ncbi:MAG: ankyrin repeat domain-containing protein [bacterium]
MQGKIAALGTKPTTQKELGEFEKQKQQLEREKKKMEEQLTKKENEALIELTYKGPKDLEALLSTYTQEKQKGLLLRYLGTDGNNLLHQAVEKANILSFFYLLRKADDLGIKNYVLTKNSKNGGQNIVEIWKDDSTTFHYIFTALMQGEINKKLGAPREEGKTILQRLVEHTWNSDQIDDLLSAVDYLIEKKAADIEVKDEAGRNILDLVCYKGLKGYGKLFKHLIENHKATSKEEETLMGIACKYAFLEGIKYLHNKEKDANDLSNKQTPLYKVVNAPKEEEDLLPVVQYLVETAKANVNKVNEDDDGNTPLHVAIPSNLVNITSYLLNRGANLYIKNKDGKTPKDLNGKPEEDVKNLIKNHEIDIKVKIKKKLEPLLKQKIPWTDDHLNKITMLISQCPPLLDEKIETLDPKQLLTEHVKFLLDQENWREEDVKKIKNLIAQFPFLLAKKKGTSNTALRLGVAAVEHSSADVLKFLLEKDKDIVEEQDQEEATLLELAVIDEESDLVGILLTNGADVNQSKWVLHYLAVHGNAEIFKLLEKQDFNPETLNSVGGETDNTPLHVALINGNIAIAEWLMGRGADVNLEGANDFTPLDLVVGMIGAAEKEKDASRLNTLKLLRTKLKLFKGKANKFKGQDDKITKKEKEAEKLQKQQEEREIKEQQQKQIDGLSQQLQELIQARGTTNIGLVRDYEINLGLIKKQFKALKDQGAEVATFINIINKLLKKEYERQGLEKKLHDLNAQKLPEEKKTEYFEALCQHKNNFDDLIKTLSAQLKDEAEKGLKPVVEALQKFVQSKIDDLSSQVDSAKKIQVQLKTPQTDLSDSYAIRGANIDALQGRQKAWEDLRKIYDDLHNKITNQRVTDSLSAQATALEPICPAIDAQITTIKAEIKKQQALQTSEKETYQEKLSNEQKLQADFKNFGEQLKKETSIDDLIKLKETTGDYKISGGVTVEDVDMKELAQQALSKAQNLVTSEKTNLQQSINSLGQQSKDVDSKPLEDQLSALKSIDSEAQNLMIPVKTLDSQNEKLEGPKKKTGLKKQITTLKESIAQKISDVEKAIKEKKEQEEEARRQQEEKRKLEEQEKIRQEAIQQARGVVASAQHAFDNVARKKQLTPYFNRLKTAMSGQLKQVREALKKVSDENDKQDIKKSYENLLNKWLGKVQTELNVNVEEWKRGYLTKSKKMGVGVSIPWVSKDKTPKNNMVTAAQGNLDLLQGEEMNLDSVKTLQKLISETKAWIANPAGKKAVKTEKKKVRRKRQEKRK